MKKDDVRVGAVYSFTHAKAGGRNAVKVVKINPKNVKTLTAGGKPWTVHPSFLEDNATPAEVDAFLSGAPSADAESLTTGMVVRFRDKREGNVPFVIIGDRAGTFRVTKLGGDKGRYWPGVLPEMLEVLDINLSLEEV